MESVKMASSTTSTWPGNCPAVPLGLQQLMTANELSVRVTETRSGRGNYTVTSGIEKLFTSSVSLTSKTGCSGERWGFYINLMNATGRTVISLRRPATRLLTKVEVRVEGLLVAVLRQILEAKPTVLVNDARNLPVLMVRCPTAHEAKCDFDLLTLTKQPIGGISKLITKQSQEPVPVAYKIVFPRDLDIKYKAAVLGASLMIDFLVHEDRLF